MDVTASIEIPAPPANIAAIMFDPAHDPAWIGGAKAVEALSPDPVAIGARTRRIGGFLGKRFSWVTEVREYEPGRLLRMAFVEGPMQGEVSYRIEPNAGGSRVSIRNHGGASFRLPGMSRMVRRSVGKDPERLKALVLSA